MANESIFTNLMNPWMQKDAAYKPATASSAPYTGGMSQRELAFMKESGQSGMPSAAELQFAAQLQKFASGERQAVLKQRNLYMKNLSEDNQKRRLARSPDKDAEKKLAEALGNKTTKWPTELSKQFQQVKNAYNAAEKEIKEDDSYIYKAKRLNLQQSLFEYIKERTDVLDEGLFDMFRRAFDIDPGKSPVDLLRDEYEIFTADEIAEMAEKRFAVHQPLIDRAEEYAERVGLDGQPREATEYQSMMAYQAGQEALLRSAGLPNRAMNLYMQPFMPTYIRETAPGGARRRRRAGMAGVRQDLRAQRAVQRSTFITDAMQPAMEAPEVPLEVAEPAIETARTVPAIIPGRSGQEDVSMVPFELGALMAQKAAGQPEIGQPLTSTGIEVDERILGSELSQSILGLRDALRTEADPNRAFSFNNQLVELEDVAFRRYQSESDKRTKQRTDKIENIEGITRYAVNRLERAKAQREQERATLAQRVSEIRGQEGEQIDSMSDAFEQKTPQMIERGFWRTDRPPEVEGYERSTRIDMSVPQNVAHEAHWKRYLNYAEARDLHDEQMEEAYQAIVERNPELPGLETSLSSVDARFDTLERNLSDDLRQRQKALEQAKSAFEMTEMTKEQLQALAEEGDEFAQGALEDRLLALNVSKHETSLKDFTEDAANREAAIEGRIDVAATTQAELQKLAAEGNETARRALANVGQLPEEPPPETVATTEQAEADASIAAEEKVAEVIPATSKAKDVGTKLVAGLKPYKLDKKEADALWESIEIEFGPFIEQASKETGMPRSQIAAIIAAETGGRRDVWSGKTKSSAGASGPMQMIPGTARDQGLAVDLKRGIDERDDPRKAIGAGADYWMQQYNKFGDPNLASAAYNAGPSAVTKYGGVPPFTETEGYVPKVSVYEEYYREKYADEDKRLENTGKRDTSGEVGDEILRKQGLEASLDPFNNDQYLPKDGGVARVG